MTKKINKESELENSNPKAQQEKGKKQSGKKKCHISTSIVEAKPVQTIQEALQKALNKEISIKNKNGKVEKTTYLEALATKTLEDALDHDGPTRRLLFRQDFINLAPKEEEKEPLPPDEQNIADVEKEYGKLLRQWAELPHEAAEELSRVISNWLIDRLNEATRV